MVEPKRQLTKDPIIHRIIRILGERGISEKELVERLGMSRGTFTTWKYGRIKSYMSHINEIAEILDVSPNLLLRGEDEEVNVETLSEAEIRLIKGYRAANSSGQRHIVELIGYIESAMEKEKGKRKRRTG